MPIYQFVCSKCLTKFEKTYNINQEKFPNCPNPFCSCDKIWRVFNSNPPIFKGKDFYVNSNRDK